MALFAIILNDARRTAAQDFANAYDMNDDDASGDALFLDDSQAQFAETLRDNLTPDENAAITDADVQTVAREYACAYLNIIRSARAQSIACVCGPDHDCRSTGCDDDCAACCGTVGGAK